LHEAHEATTSSAKRAPAPTAVSDALMAEIRGKLKKSPDVRGGLARISSQDGRLIVNLTGPRFFERAMALAEGLVEGGSEVTSVKIALQSDGKKSTQLIEIAFVH
jgi:hypothetical protein